MGQKKSTKAKRAGFFTAGALMMISALMFWVADIGTVFALCLAASGLCLFAAGLNVEDKEND